MRLRRAFSHLLDLVFGPKADGRMASWLEIALWVAAVALLVHWVG